MLNLGYTNAEDGQLKKVVFQEILSCSDIDENVIGSVDYYDKDGYELTELEQKIYSYNHYVLKPVLNKMMLIEHWLPLNGSKGGSLYLTDVDHRLYVDHAMILMRCEFTGQCKEHLLRLARTSSPIRFLLQAKPKWGIDVDINYITEDKIYEIVHLEYDSYNLREIEDIKGKIEEYFRSSDPMAMADHIIEHEHIWSNLNGLEQNDWKARAFGFPKAEDTRKSI